MHTLVVIVNYCTADLTVDCLRSLAPEIAAVSQRHGPAKVLVTDNASPDDSAGVIERAIADNGWSEWARLQRLDRNGGFAYGNNQGIRPALASNAPPKYFWLLNPDTVVRSGALEAMISFLDEQPKVGIAGSRLENHDGSPQRSAFRFPSVASEVDNGLRFGLVSKLLSRHIVAPPPPSTRCETDWLSGASLLIRREVFRDIGLMDEGFFMYYEEVDLCRRAREAGWTCWYVPESRVVHLVGQASGITLGPAKRRAPYWFESRRRYFLKHQGKVRTLLADTLFLVTFATWRLRRRVQRKPDRDPARFLGDFARHSVWRSGFRTS